MAKKTAKSCPMTVFRRKMRDAKAEAGGRLHPMIKKRVAHSAARTAFHVCAQSEGPAPLGPTTAQMILDMLGTKGISAKALFEGMMVEQEHGDLTGGDPVITAMIALSHLKEKRNYYKLLKKYVE